MTSNGIGGATGRVDTRITAVVPAAGKSERFGLQKLLADLDGRPLLDRTIGSLLDAGIAQVIVVTAPGTDLRPVPLVADSRVQVVVNKDPSRGMMSSIQTGLAAADGDPILILPGDMPFVTSETVSAVAAACRQHSAVVVPRLGSKRGHPVGIPGDLRASILAARPEASLSDVLKYLGVDRIEIDVPDIGILRDVDVPSDLGSMS